LYMDLNGNNSTYGIFALCRNTMNSSFPDFIDSTGEFHEQGQADSPPVTCPSSEGDAGP
jgi:hypothetical protein